MVLEDLIKGQGCDEERFREVVETSSDLMLRWCSGKGGISDVRDAEEILSDVFSELWDKISPEMSVELRKMQLERFLLGRLRWRCGDRHRKFSRTPPPEQIAELTEVEPIFDELEPDELSEINEFLEHLEHCLNQLPSRQHEVVLMYVEGKNQTSIARRLKISGKAVHEHIWKRAVPKLYICLEASGFGTVEFFQVPSFFERVRAFFGRF